MPLIIIWIFISIKKTFCFFQILILRNLNNKLFRIGHHTDSIKYIHMMAIMNCIDSDKRNTLRARLDV